MFKKAVNSAEFIRRSPLFYSQYKYSIKGQGKQRQKCIFVQIN